MWYRTFQYFIVILCLGIFQTSYTQEVNEEIHIHELKQHIKILASDSLEGRKPGTRGGNLAADYIKSQLIPISTPISHSYFQKFNIISGYSIGGDNFFRFGNYSFIPAVDYIPVGYGVSAELDAELVFAGYGLEVKKNELEWNDYKNIDVSGKWVLIVRGGPDNIVDHKRFLQYSIDRLKIKKAISKGAKGVILVNSPFFKWEDRLMNLTTGNKERDSIPVIHLKISAADKLLSKKNGIRKLEQKMVRKKKSSAFSINKKVHIRTQIIQETIPGKNVLGVIEGNDPFLKNEYIVVGAHYDHLGFGGYRSGSRMSDQKAIHNGADDNASGVASIIEIGEKLYLNRSKLKRSVLLIAFDGEEMGLLGSFAFIKSKLIAVKSLKSMFNFDMVGRYNNSLKQLKIKGTGTSKDWDVVLKKGAKGSNVDLVLSEYGLGPSDHANFYRNKIPAIMITTGLHSDYHTPYDVIEKINFKGQKIVSDIAYELIFNAATEPLEFTFTPTTYKSKTGLGVDLGIIPDVKSKIKGGLQIRDIVKNSYSDKAGLLKGDIITKINNVKIKSLKEYVHFIQKLKKGQDLSISIVREKSFKTFQIKLD